MAALLYVAELPPDKLLRVEQVLTLILISLSTWRRGVRSGRFPPGVAFPAHLFSGASMLSAHCHKGVEANPRVSHRPRARLFIEMDARKSAVA